jgi:class 3 adenylate cyclase/tetratricopeptide (TPR) repeat protein
MRFCGQCGLPLVSRCPKCEAENSPKFRFCGACGSPLNADGPTADMDSKSSSAPTALLGTSEREDEALQAERKTVTALFADIVGSTSLIESLDPDEARALIDPALKLMIDVVRQYDGYVVHSKGDGIFVLFGAPITHEDHPQRAVYAALDMQVALKRYAAKSEDVRTIAARVGINTGEVVVRTIQSGGHAEYVPVGLTAHLAARIQTITPSGAVGLGETTRRLVQGFFDLEPLGAFQLKGIREPVTVCKAVGVGPLRTRFQVAARRGLTRLVGREREMSQLRGLLADVLEGSGKIVVIVAEAGIGKSRLVHEFKAMAPRECVVLEASSASHTKASAFQPLVEILHEHYQIVPGDDPQRRRDKVCDALGALDANLSDTRPYVFGLLGIQNTPDPLAHMDSDIRRRKTFEAIKRILLRESLEHPLVIIFEDLQWIDPDSNIFLNLLAESISGARILLMASCRPEYRHTWANRSNYAHLGLEPLSHENAMEMLAVLLGSSAELSELKRLVVERAAGNPLFIEELVHSLFEQGSLVAAGAPRLGKRLTDIRVPTSVHAILASRIDRLPTVEKELLQTLAVVGRKAPLQLVARVWAGPPDQLERSLAELQSSEFIFEWPATEGVEYTFKHPLTQEVAYNSLIAERRKILHERIGDAMVALHVANLDDHLSEIARHYRSSANDRKALDYLRRAGARAVRRSAHQEAMELLDSAMQLALRIPDEKARAASELAVRVPLNAAIMLRRGYAAPELEKSIMRTYELARELGDPRHRASALISAGAFLLVHGELQRARGLVDELLELADRQPDLISAANFYCGDLLLWRGEFGAARECFERAISHHDLKTRTFQDPLTSSIAALANTLWILGYPDQALGMSERAAREARELGHPFTLAMVSSERTGLLTRIGEHQKALDSANEAIALAKEYGFPIWVAFGGVGRGQALLGLDRCEEATAELRNAVNSLRALGTRLCVPGCMLWIAEAQLRLGQAQAALATLEEARHETELANERLYEAEIARCSAEAFGVIEGETERSREWFRKAIEIARRQGAKSWELRATMSLARLFDKQCRCDEARAMLGEIYGWFTEGFDTADLKEARTLLDELDQ